MSEETKKDEQRVEKPEDPEAEYERAWQEVSGEEGKPDEKESEKEAEKPEQAQTQEEAPQQQTEPGTEQRTEERIAGIEKALKDTKAWATRLAQENAELKRTIEAYEKGQASRQDVEAQKKAVEDARKGYEQAQDSLESIKKRVYEDYPELQDLLDPMFEMTQSMKSELEEIKREQQLRQQEAERARALEEFELRVKPQVMKVHPDFEEIIFQRGEDGRMMLNDEYFQWAMQQRPSLRFAATESSDPQDIIWAISEFKKFKGTPEAEEFRHRQQAEKEKKRVAAAAVPPGSGPAMPISAAGGPSEDDYDAAWAEATRKLEKT